MNNQLLKKIAAIVMSFSMILSFAAISFADEEVSYIDADGETQFCDDYHLIDGTETVLEDGWYVVSTSFGQVITTLNQVKISGEVNIILEDNALWEFTPNGEEDEYVALNMQRDSILNIYAQSKSYDTCGVLHSKGEYNRVILVNDDTELNIYGGAFISDQGDVIDELSNIEEGSATPNSGKNVPLVNIYDGYFIANEGNGIQLDNGSKLYMYGGEISNCYDGINAWGSYVEMLGGTIYDCEYGIDASSDSTLFLLGGEIKNCDYGVDADNIVAGGDAKVTDNASNVSVGLCCTISICDNILPTDDMILGVNAGFFQPKAGDEFLILDTSCIEYIDHFYSDFTDCFLNIQDDGVYLTNYVREDINSSEMKFTVAEDQWTISAGNSVNYTWYKFDEQEIDKETANVFEVINKDKCEYSSNEGKWTIYGVSYNEDLDYADNDISPDFKLYIPANTKVTFKSDQQGSDAQYEVCLKNQETQSSNSFSSYEDMGIEYDAFFETGGTYDIYLSSYDENHDNVSIYITDLIIYTIQDEPIKDQNENTLRATSLKPGYYICMASFMDENNVEKMVVQSNCVMLNSGAMDGAVGSTFSSGSIFVIIVAVAAIIIAAIVITKKKKNQNIKEEN